MAAIYRAVMLTKAGGPEALEIVELPVESPGPGQLRVRVRAAGVGIVVCVHDGGIAGFNADDVRARLRKLNLKFDGSNSKESFKFFDPDGFQVQVNAPDYVGHVGS